MKFCDEKIQEHLLNGEKIFYTKTPTNRRKEWAYFKQGTSRSFVTALCHAYELGDFLNRRRLELAFPYLFSAAREWYYADNPEATIQQILSEEE